MDASDKQLGAFISQEGKRIAFSVNDCQKHNKITLIWRRNFSQLLNALNDFKVYCLAMKSMCFQATRTCSTLQWWLKRITMSDEMAAYYQTVWPKHSTHHWH